MAEQELARDLGFLEAYTLGLGTMIGAGIFVLPGIVAGRAGPASMVSFMIGGVVALLAALSLSELATGMPRAGGSYYYVNQALGSLFGSIVGWGMWGGLMFATAFYMLGFGQYLASLHPLIPVGVSALAMSVILVFVNYRGVKETGSLQNVIVILLVGLIIVFIVFGLFAIDPSLLTPFTPNGWSAVGLTAGTVFVTFIGFEVIATSAEEIKNPARNLPLSMVAAVVTPTILYVLVMLVSTGVLPIATLSQSSVPVADVAHEYLGTAGALAMIVGAVLATVSSANASILSAARVNFAMGRDRVLTDWLNQIHEQFLTPYRAILATGAVILLLIALPVPLDTLADVAAFMYLITYALVHIAVVVMRRADPAGYEPTFTIPPVLYPVVPIVGSIACLGVMIQMRPIVQGIGLGIVAVGVIWYLSYARERSEAESLLGEAVAPTVAGEEDETDRYTVVVPVANPATEEPLLRYGAASAAGHDGPAEMVAINVIEVPPQTSLAQEIESEEARVERQRELLDQARDVIEGLGLPVRTRAIVGRNAAQAVLSVLGDEEADHVMLGWAGPRNRRDVVFGTTVDPVIERAECDVTLVKDPTRHPGGIVTLAGRGPNAPVAARRAGEIVRAFQDASLTLLNVQPTGDDEDEVDAMDRGRRTIDDVAEAAGLDSDDFEPRVIISDDVRAALIEHTAEYDTVVVGATGESTLAQALFGSIPRDIVARSEGTVLMARGPDRSPRTIKQALVERLSR